MNGFEEANPRPVRDAPGRNWIPLTCFSIAPLRQKRQNTTNTSRCSPPWVGADPTSRK